MSDDKLSEEELREDIKNLLSWGHAHDYDDIIQEARADAWDHAIEHVSQLEADVGFMEHYKPHNPYREANDDY